MLGFPRSWPVRGEPELAGGGAKGERHREEDLAQFRARIAELGGGEVAAVVGWGNVGLG